LIYFFTYFLLIFTDLPEKTKRQNLLFSATFSNQIKQVAINLLNNYYFCSISKENDANENIEQVIINADEDKKLYKLHEILQKIKGSCLIFLETKRGVDSLSNFLNRANYNTISIHGDKAQSQRLAAIQKFSKGDIPILIATDVASRGLDFPNIPYVFNFDLPKNIDDYIHRIGRTGRCGNKGTAISFINDTNKPIVKDLYNLFKKHRQEIPEFFEELYKKFQYEKFGINLLNKFFSSYFYFISL
jgi:ATP-dependent RNA helicase DDX3X